MFDLIKKNMIAFGLLALLIVSILFHYYQFQVIEAYSTEVYDLTRYIYDQNITVAYDIREPIREILESGNEAIELHKQGEEENALREVKKIRGPNEKIFLYMHQSVIKETMPVGIRRNLQDAYGSLNHELDSAINSIENQGFSQENIEALEKQLEKFNIAHNYLESITFEGDLGRYVVENEDVYDLLYEKLEEMLDEINNGFTFYH